MRAQAIAILLGLGLGCAAPPPEAPEPDAAAAAVSGPSSHFADHDGRQVHYLDAGAGDVALVWIHGWACDGRVWRSQLEPLSEHHRLLVVDLPGHGRSDPPAGEYSMELFAAATRAVMADAGVRRAILIGHSNGVPVVRQFYRRYPDQVAGLVLVDGALKAMFSEEQATGLLAMFRDEAYRDHIRGMITGMPAPGLSEARRNEILSMALEQPQPAVVGGLQASIDPAIWEPDPIEAPLLVLLAEQPAWTDEYEAFVRELAPRVDYRTWSDGAGHFLMVERPEAFNSLVLEFAATVAATP